MNLRSRCLPALLIAFTACTGAIDGADDPGGDQPSAPAGGDVVSTGDTDQPLAVPMVSHTFVESDAELLNPERGFYQGYDLRAAGNAGSVRANGRTLAITMVHLDAYRNAPLDAALLDSLTRGFAAARAGGIKVILRFAYNSSMTDDAPRDRILGHITQLTPLLRANADVIAVMQAGFIGAWGEWHSSTNGLDNTADRSAILNAILTALPASRQVAIRTPMFKDAIFPGGPLTEEEAYRGTPRARVGHHNDCFLASATDLGTYDPPVNQWMAYVAQDGLYTAVGGETCGVYAPRSACAPALAEMSEKHWSYLNSEYNQAVIAGWDTGGCSAEIRRRLGYRFVLTSAMHNQAVAPGGELEVGFDVVNRGFASPFNARPVDIVLSGPGTRVVARLGGIDARQWKAGEVTSVAARLRVPATLAAGTYKLAVRLPDDSPSLADDPRYAIRMANDEVWDEATGDNVLTDSLTIDPTAPGPRTGATMFTELP
ncbi:MAG TPA: DUF4832 domain-containing protein [Kofleriaceae bacterium]|nr:DUF4832 domain-containing protein [Kofleriaceae bacterium]